MERLELEADGASFVNIPCQQCDRTFSSERSLRCHVKVHNDKVLKCCFCDQMFNRTDILFSHTIDHISKGTVPCRAEGCGVIVDSIYDGENHAIEKHSIGGGVQIKCKDCSEIVPSFRKMLNHHTFKHGELKTFADEMSRKQKEFLRIKRNLSRKEKKTTDDSEDLEDNISEFARNSNLGQVIRSEQDQEQEYAKEENNEVLEQLQIAMANTTESNSEMIDKFSDVIAALFPLASGEQYQCLHCKMGFTDAILWMTHLGYHDAENPFKCSECKREFETRKTFVLHLTYFAHGHEANNHGCN